MPEDPVPAAASAPAFERPDVRAGIAAWAAILTVAVGSLLAFYSRGLINLYGDSMAHLEGARRLIDSLTPGYAEIGTVWLPIPHLLMALPAQNDFLWRTGLAGGIVSTIAFMLAAWILFRLSLSMNGSLAAATVTLTAFLLCPNMLYLASTPLTEPLALLCVVLLVYALFCYWQTGSTAAWVGAALAGFVGTLTRYECWSLLPFAALFVLLAREDSWRNRIPRALLFALVAGAGPMLWLLHNAYRFGNPLEFYTGPFSAKGIYEHQLATTAFRFPTDGSRMISARYYLEDLRLVIGVWPLVLALLGLIAWAVDGPRRARRAAALLLLVPLPFHIQSMAHAAVPLYVPTLFPNTYWNLRLGMEMLPAVALLASFLAPAASKRVSGLMMGVLLLILVAQYASTLARGAEELAIAKEGVLNTPCHSKRQQDLTQFLRERYDGQTILMAAGKWPCVLPALGIPYRKTLSDENQNPTAQLSREPEKLVEWIVRGSDEPVDWLMRAHPEAFKRFVIVFEKQVAGEGQLVVYHRKPQ